MSVLIFLFTLMMLTGCTQTPSDNQLTAVSEITQAQPIIQIPTKKEKYHLVYGNDPKLEHAFNQYLATGKSANIITDSFIKFAYNADQLPVIKTTPLQETVVSLENGEKFTTITSGDPSRWSYSVAVSGSGPNQQQNVLVKPSLPNLSTNLVITTDRRIYNLRLISSIDTKPLLNVAFWYPEKMIEAINDASLKQSNEDIISSVPNINLKSLNFDYVISCGWFCRTPSWQPIRIFDDGVHTYIQFPSNLTNRDLPVLFIINNNNKELVNYRSKSPYFVVDKVLNQAVLMMGSGHNQTQVRITNRHYV